MKKYLFFLLLTMGIIVSCQQKHSANDPDACTCAKEDIKTEKNDSIVNRCGELRSNDLTFEEEYQMCYLAAKAGLDTSQVKISEVDSINGINLPAASGGSYTINPAKSVVKWLAKKVTGQHNGIVNVKSGSVEIADGLLKGGTLVIDMTSIVVSDQTGDSKARLEKHLNSADFFDSEKNPDAIFTIKNVTPLNKHQFEIVGDFTLKGITKEQRTKLTITPNGDKEVNVSGGIAIDRTQYNIRYGSGKFFSDLGDKMIDDVFLITVDLKASVQ